VPQVKSNEKRVLLTRWREVSCKESRTKHRGPRCVRNHSHPEQCSLAGIHTLPPPAKVCTHVRKNWFCSTAAYLIQYIYKSMLYGVKTTRLKKNPNWEVDRQTMRHNGPAVLADDHKIKRSQTQLLQTST